MTREELQSAIQDFWDEAFNHSVHPEISAESKMIAFQCMIDEAKRRSTQPLTLEELRRMDGEPVWVTFLDDVFTIGHTAPLWMIVNAEEKEFQAKNEYVCFSDIGCIAYPSKPKGRE